MRIRPRVAAVGATALLCVAATAAGPAAAAPEPSGAGAGKVSVEYFPSPDAEGRYTEVPASAPGRLTDRKRSAPDRAPARAAVGAIQDTGPTDARLDLVVMGDGYTADQQGDFQADARAKVEAVFQIEPYKSYRDLFNIWVVDAVSQESGVSGDPTKDVVRNTALSSYFWCGDIERLLCVDIDKVSAHAAQAPAADIVFVLANTTMYGGAGYSGVQNDVGYDGIATMSSDNDRATLIGAHELGHSIGHLADEYTYDSYGRYQGAEPADRNSSVHQAPHQLANRVKWWRWMGEQDPAGGTVGTYEGSGYHPQGLYRPTENSLMRKLDTDAFNHVGREGMINGFYRYAKALTTTTPTDRPVRSDQRLRARLADFDRKGIARVELRWYVDGAEVRKARGERVVTPRELGVRKHRGHWHGRTITARAVDTTSAIRDPQVREAASSTVTWTMAR
ncbi:M64 family metallopeptidase [Streptomyces uncialis]|uniref:M64 family metallopeptidase n=1 Tax=Streptomyces TaxID=1883 RepID=UPI000823CDE7|nr:M64 family metallopeptidase [Streptomyces sp. AmelKG-E11A]SCK52891.1 IgA Peptidase M64 [Streptomyces sp. AmelKG-E11A]